MFWGPTGTENPGLSVNDFQPQEWLSTTFQQQANTVTLLRPSPSLHAVHIEIFSVPGMHYDVTPI